MTRRELLKRMAAAAAVSAGQALFPGIVFAAADTAAAADGVEWKKTPCRFCGVGCGLLVAWPRAAPSPSRATRRAPSTRASAASRATTP